jgi:O-antigen ligase
MIVQLASVGSAFSLICGIGIVALGYFGLRKSYKRTLVGALILIVSAAALFWAMFGSENILSKRIQTKLSTHEIDRLIYWEEGIREIGKTPFGEGWSYRTGHSDWLLYFLSYGWATGLMYFTASILLFITLWRKLIKNRASRNSLEGILPLVGLTTLSVYAVNSVLDMLSANIGYFQTVWALILTASTVEAVSANTVPPREY